MREGRNSNGHFTRGNHIGTGNHGNKRMAELRRALLDSVTPERVKEVGEALYKMAIRGDASAAKVWLEFTVGKPVQAVEVSAPEATGPTLSELMDMILPALEPWPEARWAIAAALRAKADSMPAEPDELRTGG